MTGPWDLLSTDKSFTNPWIGNPLANRLGLHLGRILLFDAIDRVRWAAQAPLAVDKPHIAELRRNGVVAIRDFLPAGEFAVVRDEAIGRMRESLVAFPPRDNREAGFGAKEPFGTIGFDRFDGGTLNRFLSLTPERTPKSLAMVRSERFRKLYSSAQGRSFPLSAISIYYTRHGPDDVHDLQKDLHSDTFHFTVKLWYFLADVPPEAGPFHYVIGSHLSTPTRLKWEYARSIAARDHPVDKGGSFRIMPDELRELGYPAPTAFAVPANTLVIADTNGFHCRGEAKDHAERFAIYAGMRRSPFLP